MRTLVLAFLIALPMFCLAEPKSAPYDLTKVQVPLAKTDSMGLSVEKKSYVSTYRRNRTLTTRSRSLAGARMKVPKKSSKLNRSGRRSLPAQAQNH